MIASNFFESSSGESSINYYSQDKPNNDKYCIRWEKAAQYQQIGWDSKPNKDLSLLVDQGYALDFMFRGNQPVTFDLRFIDSDTEDPQDHPWRMKIRLDGYRPVGDCSGTRRPNTARVNDNSVFEDLVTSVDESYLK